MTTYLVTGGTGFLGQRLVAALLQRPECDTVHVLVRPTSTDRLDTLIAGWPQPQRVQPLPGDLAEPNLGLAEHDLRQLNGAVDHVLHVGANYDMTASEETARAANVDGTRHVLDVAARIRAGCVHHVSSIAVAGDHRGEFGEDDFDVGQSFDSPYHATKFEAERLVRDTCAVPWRVYRPAVVVGDSRTGEIDKVDGPYYFLPSIARAAALPSATPLVAPDLGATNVVPVDFVVAALDHLVHTVDEESTRHLGRTFHLMQTRPTPLTEIYDAFAEAAGAPRLRWTLPASASSPLTALGRLAARGAQSALNRIPGGNEARDALLHQLGIPAQVLPHMALPTRFTTERTRTALGANGPRVPRFRDYAGVLWQYWNEYLNRRPRSALSPTSRVSVTGRRVVITGASSGIGRRTALKVAERGAVPLLVARRGDELEAVRREIEEAGGAAHCYPCDLTDDESVRAMVKRMLAEHDSIDMLVNNAGRSIRRSVRYSVDRLHDFERTAAINYFAPVRLTLALLPHMRNRGFGHVVNISSQGVQLGTPRFSAYLASKAALDMFSRVSANELRSEGVTFSTVHMPLVRTPMSAPTPLYRLLPAASPERAARIVLRALEHRPHAAGGGLLGWGAEAAHGLAPRTLEHALNLAYRVAGESPEVKRNATAGRRGAGDTDHLEPAVLSTDAEAHPRDSATGTVDADEEVSR